MIWSVAWKNIWRNKVRSLVVIFSVMIGIFSAIMLVGIMSGWINQRVHSTIHNEISHVQIHHPDFILNEELQYVIPDFQKISDSINHVPGVVSFTPRVKIFAFAQSDWSSTGLSIKGIIPEKEKLVTLVHTKLIEGEFLEGEQVLPDIVIGSEAAENLRLLNYEITDEKIQSLDKELFCDGLKDKLSQLKGNRFRTKKDFKKELENALEKKEYEEFADLLVKHFSFYRIRSKITVTLQNIKGELVYVTFRVKGIYKTDNAMFDGVTAFVKANVLQNATGLASDDYHEIAILSENDEDGISASKLLKKEFPKLEVMSWKEMSPELSYYSDFMKVLDYIYVSIFLFALAFGIINTMLMAVLERVKELGMLMAIGMNKKRVFSMIMLESIFLSLTGAVIGMVISGLTVSYLGKTGINLSMWAEGLEAFGYASIIYPNIPFDIFVGVTILVIITGILSSIWPARKALKLNPADALRTE